jgi:hypothetical protein
MGQEQGSNVGESNKEVIFGAVREIESWITSTDFFQQEQTISDEVDINLLDKNGVNVPCSLRIVGEVQEGFLSIDVQIISQGNTQDPIANRDYYLTKSKIQSRIAEVNSDLFVENALREAGIGSSLIKIGEEVRHAFFNHNAKKIGIDGIRSVINDVSTPSYWSERRAKELGYTQTDDGKFEKTEYFVSLLERLRHNFMKPRG